jgi:hypothetical protein
MALTQVKKSVKPKISALGKIRFWFFDFKLSQVQRPVPINHYFLQMLPTDSCLVQLIGQFIQSASSTAPGQTEQT